MDTQAEVAVEAVLGEWVEMAVSAAAAAAAEAAAVLEVVMVGQEVAEVVELQGYKKVVTEV